MSKFTRMPQYIKDAYRKNCMDANHGGKNAIIAGGAIRDTLNGVWVKDIDIFVDARCASAYESVIGEWTLTGRGGSKLFDRYGDALLWQPSSTKTAPSMSIPYGATQGAASVYMNNMNGMITFSAPGAVTIATMQQGDPGYLNNKRIVEVYEKYDTIDGITYPLNLIFTECPPVEYVTKYFDFGLCKTWYDGEFVHMHGDYTNDVNNKTITMVLPDEHIIACYGSVAEGVARMQDHVDRLRAKYPSHKVVMPSV